MLKLGENFLSLCYKTKQFIFMLRSFPINTNFLENYVNPGFAITQEFEHKGRFHPSSSQKSLFSVRKLSFRNFIFFCVILAMSKVKKM